MRTQALAPKLTRPMYTSLFGFMICLHNCALQSLLSLERMTQLGRSWGSPFCRHAHSDSDAVYITCAQAHICQSFNKVLQFSLLQELETVQILDAHSPCVVFSPSRWGRIEWPKICFWSSWTRIGMMGMPGVSSYLQPLHFSKIVVIDDALPSLSKISSSLYELVVWTQGDSLYS